MPVNQMGRIDPKTERSSSPDLRENPVARKAAWILKQRGVGLHGAGKLMKIDYKTVKRQSTIRRLKMPDPIPSRAI